MSSSFRSADFGLLAECYNAFYPDRYRIDAELLRQKTVDSPVFDWGASCFHEGHGFLAVKKSAASLYKGPDLDTAHITALAFKDPNQMVDLMNEVKRCLRNRGLAKLQFGMDSAHLFPGCPEDFHALRDFLIIGGFNEGGEVHDLERDLKDYENPFSASSENEFRPCAQGDLPHLKQFFQREFPGRWQYDVFDKIDTEKDPSTVFALFRGKSIEGFSLVQQDGCKKAIGGGVWKADLGAKWGALGPIGVSKELRGNGLGNALLGKSLEFLRDKGTRRCIIDWTGLIKFYGGHGFEVTRTYRYMSLDLEPV